MKFIYFLIKPFLGKKSLASFWEKVYIASLLGMNCGGATDAKQNDSGETICFKYLKENMKKDKYVIFDVGANEGQYATEIIKHFDSFDYDLHSFEPSKKIFKILKKTIEDNDSNKGNIKLNNFGLNDSAKTLTLYSTNIDSGMSSLFKRDLKEFGAEMNNTEEVKLDTLDTYCKKNNIENIDLLKMDIEGNELNALMGSKNMLKEGKIQSIQIEFGGANIASRTYLKDFWDLLSENYKMYRIMKNGLYEIKEYKETMEIFFCTNYYFVKK